MLHESGFVSGHVNNIDSTLGSVPPEECRCSGFGASYTTSRMATGNWCDVTLHSEHERCSQPCFLAGKRTAPAVCWQNKSIALGMGDLLWPSGLSSCPQPPEPQVRLCGMTNEWCVQPFDRLYWQRGESTDGASQRAAGGRPGPAVWTVWGICFSGWEPLPSSSHRPLHFHHSIFSLQSTL